MEPEVSEQTSLEHANSPYPEPYGCIPRPLTLRTRVPF
jgi:hypothetical protein